MMAMEINLPWQDIVSLIHDPYGWRNRYDELNFGFRTSLDHGFVWRGANYELAVISGREESCLLGLFMDNDKPADDEATRTWEKLQELLLPYTPNHESELSDSRHKEIMVRLDELMNGKKPHRKTTRRKSKVPQRRAEQLNWSIFWNFIEARVIAENPTIRALRTYLDSYNFDDKPDWIPRDNETLQSIILEGRAGNIPKINQI